MPELEPGALLCDGNDFLSVRTMSAPSVIDWNADGKKDLLVGQFDSGNVWLFLNKGTDQKPVFKGGTRLLSGGEPVNTTYG